MLQFNGDEAGVREMARSAIRFNSYGVTELRSYGAVTQLRQLRWQLRSYGSYGQLRSYGSYGSYGDRQLR